MNIYSINTLLAHIEPLLPKNTLNSVSAQQQKIIGLALIALGGIACLFLSCRYCFRAKQQPVAIAHQPNNPAKDNEQERLNRLLPAQEIGAPPKVQNKPYPTLVLLHEHVDKAFDALNKLEGTLDQHGFDTQAVYDKQKMNQFVTGIKLDLKHPLEDRQDPHLFVAWEALLSELREAHRKLRSLVPQDFILSEEERQIKLEFWKSTDILYDCLAKGYYFQNDFQKSGQAVFKIVLDYETRESFLLKIANDYYQRKSFKGAFTIIKHIKHNIKYKDDFCLKLAKMYFDKSKSIRNNQNLVYKNLQNSLDILKEVKEDHQNKEALLFNIIDKYFNYRNYQAILPVLREINHDEERKESWVTRLLNIHRAANDYQKMTETIQEAYANNPKMKDALLNRMYELKV